MTHTTAVPDEPMLTRDQVAVRLALKRNTLDHLGKKGPPFVRVGRSIRYDRRVLDRWISDRTEAAA